MPLIDIDKGDSLLLKDGRVVRVLSVFRPAGKIIRVDVVDDTQTSPMREAIFEREFARVMKKAVQVEPVAAPLPPEQAVKEKEPVSAAITADVAGRERQKTSSAEHKSKAEGKK